MNQDQKTYTTDSWNLLIEVGNQAPYEISLDTSQCVTIGRAECCDICIKSRIVSNKQGYLKYDEQTLNWVYTDTRSTNGTFVNGILYQYGYSVDYREYIPIMDGAILEIDDTPNGTHEKGVKIRLQQGEAAVYQAYPIPPNRPFVFGRATYCDLTIDSPNLSSEGLFIEQKGARYSIRIPKGVQPVIINGMKVSDGGFYNERTQIFIASKLLVIAGGFVYLREDENSKGEVMLRVRHLTRRKGAKLDDVSLDIKKGEIVAIIGGSGAGKSTLLNAISGRVKPDSGEVFYKGNDLFEYYEVLNSQIAFVPQKDIMHSRLTVRETLDYAARLRCSSDMKKKEREERVDKVINKLDIQKISDNNNLVGRNVSGGQKKRVSIGIEMISDPELFFLDEPTSGLDPGTEKHLMDSLQRMARVNNKTIVLVTHSTLVFEYCDKIIVMGEGGKLCFYGKPRDMLTYFQTHDYSSVYNKIDGEDNANKYKNYFDHRRNDLKGKNIKNDSSSSVHNKPVLLTQAKTLISRGFLLMCRDRKKLYQEAVIAALLPWIAVFVGGENTGIYYSNTYRALFTVACIGVLCGLTSGYLMICNERDVLYREHKANLRIDAYMLSKATVLIVKNVVQAFLITSMFKASLILLRDADLMKEYLFINQPLEIFITLFLTVFSSSCLGLLISSISAKSENASLWLMVFILPQIVLNGVVFELKGGALLLGKIVHAFWATNGLGISLNLQKIPMEEVAIKKGIQAGMHYTPNAPELSYLVNTRPELMNCWIRLLLLGILCFVISLVVTRRKAGKEL